MRLVVVPSRDRHADLADCLEAVAAQVDRVVLIDNGSTPPLRATDYGPNVRVVVVPDQPPNLSAMWNCGLDLARSYAGAEPFSVAVLNDDAVVPPGWLEAVDSTMRELGGAAGCSAGGLISTPLVHQEPGPVDLWLRLSGHAFVLRGEVGLRADERLRFWYGDDDLDWKARALGGTVIVPGYEVEHRHPNGHLLARPELVAQTGRDRAAFTAKWDGRTPW